MNLKPISKMMVFAVLASLLFAGCKGGGGTKDVKLESEEQKAFYALGAMMGQRFKQLNLKEDEVDIVTAGLRDSALGKEFKVNPKEYQSKIGEILQGRVKNQAKEVKKKGKKFIKDFLKEEGVQETESGLAYKIIKKGGNKSPKPSDIVKVKYLGKLAGGEVFDKSQDKAVELPLNRVVKGWTEGLQLIGKGGKIELVIPSELGYGDSGVPPKIPGGSTLFFEVELVDFKENPDKGKKQQPKRPQR